MGSTDRSRWSGLSGVARSFGRALRAALHALAGSSGAAGAAMDDPRMEQPTRRQRDVPH